MPAKSPSRVYPVRHVSRLVTEYHLTGIDNMRVLPAGRYERGVLLIALARNGLPDWFAGNQLRPPREVTCFNSINALAVSFGRPFETLRRHIRALVAEGTCIEGPLGVAINPSPGVAKRLIAYLRLTHDTMLRLVEEMHASRLMPRCPAATSHPIHRAITALSLDMMLAPFESLREPLPDWSVMLVWGLIDGLCVRHVTLDPDLSRAYSQASTPDELRAPVTLRTVSAASGLPYSSVWRHAKGLAAVGSIRAKGEGYIVSADFLRGPVMEERVVGTVETYQRRLADLVRQGLDPERPMPWFGGRPALMAADVARQVPKRDSGFDRSHNG